MRMFVLGPAIGPVRMGVSVGPEDFRNVRPAPVANWRVRFAATVLLILPFFSLGLLAEQPFLGPSGAGGLYAVVALIGASAYAGTRMARYSFPLLPTALRWAGTFIAGLSTAAIGTAFLAAALNL